MKTAFCLFRQFRRSNLSAPLYRVDNCSVPHGLTEADYRYHQLKPAIESDEATDQGIPAIDTVDAAASAALALVSK